MSRSHKEKSYFSNNLLEIKKKENTKQIICITFLYNFLSRHNRYFISLHKTHREHRLLGNIL